MYDYLAGLYEHEAAVVHLETGGRKGLVPAIADVRDKFLHLSFFHGQVRTESFR